MVSGDRLAWRVAALLAAGLVGFPAAASSQPPAEEQPQEKAPEQAEPAPTETPPTETTAQPTALEVDEVTRALEAAPRWTIKVEPAAWYTAPSGKLTLPRSSPSAGGNNSTRVADLNLDNPHFTPTGEVHLRRGRMRFAMRGFTYSADQFSTGQAGQIGDIVYSETDTLDTSFDIGSIEVEGGYTIVHRDLRALQEGYVVRTNVDLVFGARAYDVTWDIDRVTAGPGVSSAGSDERFLEPLFGVKLDMVLYEQLSMDLQLTAGGLPLGDTSSVSVDIVVGFSWQATENLGLQIGYRSLFFTLQSGQDDAQMEFSGAMQGLYGGLVFTF